MASYVFEPTLSLTGNCSTSGKDEVPDPGTCPIPPGTVFSGSPGADHPSKGFANPSVTTDAYGDVYVVNITEEEGRIDIFGPTGDFLTEVKDETGPQSIAVDSKGNMYLYEVVSGGERQIRRFPPTVYEPLKGKIEYTTEPVILAKSSTFPATIPLGGLPFVSLAVDPSTDRLYVDTVNNVAVVGSAEESNKVLEVKALSVPLNQSRSIALDAAHKRLYLADEIPGSSIVRIFELAPPHSELGKITGSTTPKGEFLSGEGKLALDVDEDAGHLFAGDLKAANKVYEFEEDGTYLETIEHSFKSVGQGEIAIDDGRESLHHPQKEGWLFVPSEPSPSLGHVYAFEPKEQGPPIDEAASVGDVTESEATLHATINPNGLPTAYRFEYVSQQQFEASGFGSAAIASEGLLPKGGKGVSVAASVAELEAGTAYHFRVFAENEEGEVEEERTFRTFEKGEPLPPCPTNEAFRTGLSALLSDCRAYELVTPPDTNGRPPSGGFSGIYFPALEASPDGSRVSFVVGGGTLPGTEGTGVADNYLATRLAEGWETALAGPTGGEASLSFPGSVSPDQTYSLWESHSVTHIRYPDGHSELVGRGSLGEDPQVNVGLITEGATHIIFNTKASSAVQLEENAPPAGTGAVYDRPAVGPTHVVSLLPGNEPQGAGENAFFLGASEDGEGIAFEIGKTIYVRLHNAETLEVAGPGSTFAGISEEGQRVFYMEGGDLFAYDAEADEAIPFSESGDVTPVNVATGGTRAYFVSPSKLTSEPNPNVEEAKAGQENLYLAEGEGQFSFVGIVTKRDVEGEKGFGGQQVGGLGLWLQTVAEGRPARDSSRTTPAGATLLFESRADLTAFGSEGFAQIYRYDASEGRLDCLSCSPTATPPTSDATLQTVGALAESHLKISNQSPSGKRAFFQTAEPLVVGDTDELLDVYEWEEKEVGSCKKPSGCVYLISGGHSSSPDYLYGMSSSGDDVFFGTADILLPRDTEATLSFYDARAGGGFAEPVPSHECEGDSCRSATPAPNMAQDTTSVVGPDGNVQRKHCPKGKHAAKRHGNEVCVKNHQKKKHRRHRIGSGRKGGAK